MINRACLVCCAIVFFVAGGVSVLSVAGAMYFGTSIFRDEVGLWPDVDFNSELWKVMPLDARYVLARDLIEQRWLDNLTKNEVVDLLGRPGAGSTKEDGTFKDNFSYQIKSGSFMLSTVQIYLLRVEFDPQTQRVSRYFIGVD